MFPTRLRRRAAGRTGPELSYVPGHDGTVYGLKASTGATLWTASINDAYYVSPPAIDTRRVFVASEGENHSNLDAFDAISGARLWSVAGEFPTGPDGSTIGAPAVSGGRVYVFRRGGDGINRLDAFDAGTGARIFSTAPIPGELQSMPVVANGTVYLATSQWDCFVYAFDQATGAARWSVATGPPETDCGVGPSAVVASGRAYVSAYAGLQALRASSGATLWSVPGRSGVVANGVLYVWHQSELRALNAATGRHLWSTSLPAGASPIVANGLLNASSYDRATGEPMLYAFGLASS